MKYKYGEFDSQQIEYAKKDIRKQIFFLLLIVDPKTKSKYENINVNDAFTNVFNILNGLNSLLDSPQELVIAICYLESALLEYNSADFEFKIYRKLILDAGHIISLL